MNRSKRRTGKRGQRAGGGSLQPGQLSWGEMRMKIQGVPFFITATAASQGCITTGESKASLTSAGSTILDPFTIGGRFYTVAQLFTQYKINRCVFRYKPYSTVSGVQFNPQTTSTTPTYTSRAMAVCVVSDPATLMTGLNDIISAGGIVCNSSKPWNLSVQGGGLGKWLYTSTTSASPTSIDARMVAFGFMRGSFEVSSSTNSNIVLGPVLVDMDVSLRGMISATAPIGLMPSQLTLAADPDSDEKTGAASQVSNGGVGGGSVGRAGLSPADVPPPSGGHKEQSVGYFPATFWKSK